MTFWQFYGLCICISVPVLACVLIKAPPAYKVWRPETGIA